MLGKKTDPHLNSKKDVFWYLIHVSLAQYLKRASNNVSKRQIFWLCPGVCQVPSCIGMLLLGQDNSWSTYLQMYMSGCLLFSLGHKYLRYLLLAVNFRGYGLIFRPSLVAPSAHVTTWWWILHRFNCSSCGPWQPSYLNHSTSKLSPYWNSGSFIGSTVSRLISCLQINFRSYFIQMSITRILNSSYGSLKVLLLSRILFFISLFLCIGSDLLLYWHPLV